MATNNAVNVGIVPGGNFTYTFPGATSTLATIALAETLTSKTLTSPIVSGAGGTTAGQQGYNATDKALLIGDGTANQSIFTSAWKAFTPSYTNLTIGNGTNAGAYCQVGKIVFFRAHVLWGSTTSISGAPVMTFPVTVSSSIGGSPIIAWVRMGVGGTVYVGAMGSGGTINVFATAAAYATMGGISATVPATWTTNDTWSIEGFYEAA